MTHRPLHGSVRWVFAIAMALVFAAAAIAPFVLVPPGLYWIPLFVVFVFLLPPLESLLLTPLYRASGRFRYYAPMLLTTRRSDGGLDLHVGTLFDYALRLGRRYRGARAARIVTADVLRGLLALCDEVEEGHLAPATPLVATSYFFSGRTLERFGFRSEPAPRATIQNLVVTSLSVAIRLSMTRGRPTFPDLRRIRSARSTAGELAEHRKVIVQYLDRLEAARM